MFSSAADNLVDYDTGGVWDIFLKDIVYGSVIRVSNSYLGGDNDRGSFQSTVNEDGTYVAYLTDATSVVEDDTNGTSDVFLTHTQTLTNTRISISTDNVEANDWSGESFEVNGDGRYVVFESYASNLVEDDTNEVTDIFLRDTQAGTTTRVNTSTINQQDNCGAADPSISSDGRYVAFHSCADNLVDNGWGDIFVKDIWSGETAVVSIASDGSQSLKGVFPRISRDGHYVIFEAFSEYLVPLDTNDRGDVFRAENPLFVPDTDGDGILDDADLDDDDDGTPDELDNCPLIDNPGQEDNDNDGQGDACDPDDDNDGLPDFLETELGTNPYAGDTDDDGFSDAKEASLGMNPLLSDPALPTTLRVSASMAGYPAIEDSNSPALSADGRYVVFQSDARNLVPGDSNSASDIFMKDFETGLVTRQSTTWAGWEGNGNSSAPVINASGRYVAFHSVASNLTYLDWNDTTDVFLKDTQTGDISCVSTDIDGKEGDLSSVYPSIDASGRYVAYHSSATDLVDDDTNGVVDVFLKDTKTGITNRLSLDGLGNEASDISSFPSITDDGQYVAFQSYADDLVTVDGNGTWDIFVKAIQGEAIKRASTNSAGDEANQQSLHPAINGTGRYAVFDSRSTNLVPGDGNTTSDVYMKDLQTGETFLVSTNSNSELVDDYSIEPSISADGRYVVFESAATDLIPGDLNGVKDIFLKDVQSGQVVRLSVSDDGEEADADSHHPRISRNGQYIVFESEATNLVNGDSDGYIHVYRVENPFLDTATMERNALVDLYNSTNGTNWTRNDFWLGDPGTECDWFGITCDIDGNVRDLVLWNNNLVGTIPTSIGYLPHLSTLMLEANSLTGSIPGILGNLDTLTHINLAANRMSGAIPAGLGKLSNLETLRLNSNNLVGEIPTSLSNLPSGGDLFIDYNGLWTEDINLQNFLTQESPGWNLSQTIAPESVAAVQATAESIRVTWDSILYTANEGRYEVHRGTLRGGPYDLAGHTADKSTTEFLDADLQPRTYYHAVRTITDPHPTNPQNQVISEFSLETRVHMLPAWEETCTDDNVDIATVMFEDGQSVSCPATESITLSDSVLVSSGATLELVAPSVTINPVFMVEPGAIFKVNLGVTSSTGLDR